MVFGHQTVGGRDQPAVGHQRGGALGRGRGLEVEDGHEWQSELRDHLKHVLVS